MSDEGKNLERDEGKNLVMPASEVQVGDYIATENSGHREVLKKTLGPECVLTVQDPSNHLGMTDLTCKPSTRVAVWRKTG